MGELISQGFVFMLVGMLVVFAFLALLVFAMGQASRFFARFAHLFPEAKEPQSNLKKISTDYADIAAVVAIAHSQRSVD